MPPPLDEPAPIPSAGPPGASAPAVTTPPLDAAESRKEEDASSGSSTTTPPATVPSLGVAPPDESARARRKRERAEQKSAKAKERVLERQQREQDAVARREAKEAARKAKKGVPSPVAAPSVPDEIAAMPAVDAPPAIDPAPAAEMTPAMDPTPAVEITPAIDPTPVVGTTPVADATPVTPAAPIPTPPAVDEGDGPVSPEAAAADVTVETPALTLTQGGFSPSAGSSESAIREQAEAEAMRRLDEDAASQESETEARITAEAERRIAEAAATASEPEPELTDPAVSEPPLDEVPFPPLASTFDRSGAPAPDPARSKLLAELRQAELQLERRKTQGDDLAHELEATEARLAQSQERTAAALERAAERLQEIEARAAEAEARAARAERLSKLKAEEVDRAERLRERLDRIADAEQRASAAEVRARDAVVGIGDPLMEIDPDSIFEPEPGHVPVLDESAADNLSSKAEVEEAPDSDFDLPPVADADLDVATDPAAKSEASSGDSGTGPSAEELDRLEQSESVAVTTGPTVNVNTASYEDLRGLGLSVTQTGRMLAFRERTGGFGSVAELESVPGLPSELIGELKPRLSVA
ncbi:hypothetical protein BH10ACT11_BH10ACT11_01460 [soil metagenome]